MNPKSSPKPPPEASTWLKLSLQGGASFLSKFQLKFERFGDPKNGTNNHSKISFGANWEPPGGLRGPQSQERPKRRPRAARSAPKGPQARPWAPKVRQEGLREAPGAHFGLILGSPGPHFQAIEASFSKLARAPPDNRKHSSKSLVKRSGVGLAGVWGQKT